MPSLKTLSVGKMLGSMSIKKKSSSVSQQDATAAVRAGDTPELTAKNSVRAFCESGGKSNGDDVLFLPPIVEAAESSPAAAAECARLIAQYMSKEYNSRSNWQYNAIMLVRILTDNPGMTFTRNLDQKFVDAARGLLKTSKDARVRQILMETLDDFEHSKGYDDNLTLLVSMWQKEKEKALKDFNGQIPPPPPAHTRPASMVPNQNYFARHHTNRRLPDPVELVSRLEEARTSAKLLEQVVMNTPPAEMLNNDLIKEFADRCLSASRSIQGYMMSDNPGPDNDTMESLIDTNEQLQTALNQHRRAVLSAKKQIGEYESPAVSDTNGGVPRMEWEDDAGYGSSGRQQGAASGSGSGSGSASGIMASRKPVGNGKGKETEVYAPPPGPPPTAAAPLSPGAGRAPPEDVSPEETADPFADPHHHEHEASGKQQEQTYPYEPYHPGFQGAPTNGLAVDTTGSTPAAQSSSSNVNAHAAPAGMRYDEGSDDDLYEASPRGKEPMNRY